jgi:serine/threonine-protein kinase
MNTTSSTYTPHDFMIGDQQDLHSGALESFSLLGRCVGGVDIAEVLATSEMSRVYLGCDRRTGAQRIVKVCRNSMAHGRHGLSRFDREIALHCKVSSRYTPRVYGSGSYRGFKFLVMEYIRGESLAAHLAQADREGRRLPGDRIFSIALALVHGLRTISRAHIVHRDIKPSNILLSDDGRVVIIDFGIATTNTNEQFTDANEVLGTVGYMSPEQWENHTVDTRSDIYAFGIVLLEMLTGLLPTQRCDLGIAINPHFSVAKLLLLQIEGEAHRDLLTIARRCLQRDRRMRYATFDEVLHDIRTIRRDASMDDDTPPPEDGWPSRSDVVLICTFLLLLVLGAWSVWG